MSSQLDQRLQTIDVQIVDVLAQLEGLLRHSHSLQRVLLTLRSEAPPPGPISLRSAIPQLSDHAEHMRRDCAMLCDIINELAAGVIELQAQAGAPNDRGDRRTGGS